MTLKQDERLLSLSTPLGPDVLLLSGFSGHEELSRLFNFRLDMLSDRNDLKASDLVGKNIGWTVKLKDERPRHFNGFVSRFVAGDEEHGRRNYRAEVVPWLWFLTRTSDCRIFQNKSFPEIIEQVLREAGFADFETSQIKGHHPKHVYCVQYRETDFNFLSRLTEEEGIFYFFTHEAGKHKLILADQKGAYFDCLEKEVDYPTDAGSRALDDHLTSWEHQYKFRTGKWSQTDYNFETPSTSLMTNVDSLVGLPGIDKFEVYDYPGEYDKTGDGTPRTKLRMEEEEVGYDVVCATSQCKTFTPGGKFKVRQHRSSAERNKKYVLTSISHTASEPTSYETGSPDGERTYRNSFTCVPDTVVYRPERLTPRPVVQGMQTAFVVGPPNEEIFPDKYGRVKVQFHWDREGKRDDKSSCWIRVSQVHAGKGFGAMQIPRIGEEVIVAFLEGDPDQPIVVGRVFHAENMPPFNLPDEKTRSGMKSKTYQGGGYNEISLDDTKGKEQIRIHGQYDMDAVVEHDETLKVGNNRTKDVGVDEVMSIGNNQQLKVGVNKTVDVGADHVETIKANQSVKIGSNQTVDVGANQATTVASNQSNTVGSAKTENVGLMSNEMVGFMKTTNVGVAYSIISGAAMNTAVGFVSAEEVGMTKKIIVGSKLEITVGKSKLVMEAGGKVTIEGTEFLFSASGNVKVNGAVIDLN